MNITHSHLPTFIRTLENNIADFNTWLGYDRMIEHLSAYDLHFFKTANQAADFQVYNSQNDKEVVLLPIDALKEYVQETARNMLKEGKQFSHLEIDDEAVLGFWSAKQINGKLAELNELMDAFDWTIMKYDPSVTITSFDEKIAFHQLEYVVNLVSSLSQMGERGMEEAKALADRHWTATPMEVIIPDVLRGKYQHAHSEIIIEHKTKTMNRENLNYLQDQVKYTGFGEALHDKIEEAIKQAFKDNKLEFELPASHEFGKDKMTAILHFKMGDDEEKKMFFFNKYDATLHKGEHPETKTICINNKGQNITFKESYNQLDTRAVLKELTPKEGDKYMAWVKLNFNDRDEHGQPKTQYYHEKYGYDVKEAVGRVALKEMMDPERFKQLIVSLEKGNLAPATLIKNGEEKAVQLAADPQFKTIKMFDMEGKKLYVPAEKQEQRFGQAPVDEKRAENGQTLAVGEELSTKKVDLMPVNEIGQNQQGKAL